MQPAAAMLDGSLDLETGIETEKRREMTNLEFANGLRLIADFYEKNETMPRFQASVYCFTAEDFRAALLMLKHGGKVTKDMSDTGTYANVIVSRQFGELELRVVVDKGQVCERIVTYRCPDSLLEEAMNAGDEAR